MKESRIPFWELHGEVCELKSAQREAGQRKRRKNTKKIFAKWKCFILASKSVQNSQQTPNVEKDVKKWDLNKIRWDRRGIILGSAAQNTSASQHSTGAFLAPLKHLSNLRLYPCILAHWYLFFAICNWWSILNVFVELCHFFLAVWLPVRPAVHTAAQPPPSRALQSLAIRENWTVQSRLLQRGD